LIVVIHFEELHGVPLDHSFGIVHGTFVLHVLSEHSGSDRQMICLVDQSLIRIIHLLTHHDMTKLVINFRVESGISDQVYNPDLRLVLGHVQPFG